MDAIFAVGESVRTLLRQSESLQAVLEGHVSVLESGTTSSVQQDHDESEDAEEHVRGKRLLAIISNDENGVEEGRCLTECLNMA